MRVLAGGRAWCRVLFSGMAHHALGFHSEAMQRWTRELGLDTERCMPPLLRLYSRVGRSAWPTTRASNDLQSTFWVQARCCLR